MKVIIEIRTPKGIARQSILDNSVDLENIGLQLDKGYEPVLIQSSDPRLNIETEEVYCIRGDIDEKLISEIEKLPNVIAVYLDTPIAPFGDNLTEQVFIEQSAIIGKIAAKITTWLTIHPAIMSR